MKATTKTALEGSIEKWQDIVDGAGVDDGQRNCPLCSRFYADKCAGCPVFESTGNIQCVRTPYDAWEDHQYGEHYESSLKKIDIDCPMCLELAQAELEFLKALL